MHLSISENQKYIFLHGECEAQSSAYIQAEVARNYKPFTNISNKNSVFFVYIQCAAKNADTKRDNKKIFYEREIKV